MHYYFAYGSNLHPVRLGDRVPSARLIAAARLPGYRLSFDKLGRDGSGKCTITPCPPSRGVVVHGALYTLELAEKPFLDEAEGLGERYLQHEVQITAEDGLYRAFTYIAAPAYQNGHLPPFTWYRDLVVEGARYLRFPGTYLRALDAVSAVPDRDAERAARHEALLARCRDMNAEALIASI